MPWEKPDFEIIEMNAEIGGYQSDFDEPELSKNSLEKERARAVDAPARGRAAGPQ